jgi:hypothetical protein
MDQHLDFLEFRENGELLLGTSALNRRSVPSLSFEIISIISIFEIYYSLPKWPEKCLLGSL